MGVEIVVAVSSAIIIAILTGLMAYFKSQAKNYKVLLQEQKEENYRRIIHEEIKPLEEELGKLQTTVLKLREEEKNHMDIIQGSYKFRLIHLCRTYIRQKYITQEQFDQLSEFFKTYTNLGGNGQAAEFYDKVLDLPIHD